MTRTKGRTRWLPLALLSIGIALVATACAGGASSPVPPPATITPLSARPTAQPRPSPSAVDVAAAFTKAMSVTFSAKAILTGSLKIGTIDGDISGDAAFDGADSSTNMTITAGTFKQETSTINVGAKAWAKKSPGPWLVTPKKSASLQDDSLSDILKSITTVTDVGVVSKGGKSLHHIQLTGSKAISGAAFGLDAATTKDAKFALDFYATDTGAPAIMTIEGSWTQLNGATEFPVVMTFDMAFKDIGKPQTISPPKDVWTMYTSKALGYSMAHPADWTVEPAKNQDTYAINGQGYVYVATEAVPKGATTAQYAAGVKATFKKDTGNDPKSETPTTLGGQPAVRLLYQYKNAQGQDVTVVVDTLARADTGWTVFLATAGGAEDIDLFNTFVATFAFTT